MIMADVSGEGGSGPEPVALTLVPALVDRALRRCWTQYEAVPSAPDGSGVEAERRRRRLAILCERESRWLGVLRRWIYSGQESVPLVFGPVTERAEAAAIDEALFWAGHAARHPNPARTDQEDAR